MRLIKGKKIQLGVVGGGPKSWIGHVHRISSRFDNQYEIDEGLVGSEMCIRDRSNDDMPELGGDTPLEQCLSEASQAGFVGLSLIHI